MTIAKRSRRRTRFEDQAFDEAFFAADFDRCRAMLHELNDPVKAALLTSRMDLREQRYVEMIQILAGLKPKARDAQIERDILLGAAYGHTRDFVAARVRLNRALQEAQPGSQLRNDALFCMGLVAWLEHEHRECEGLMREALQHPSPNNQARAHVLLSWIAARRRDLELQVKEMIATLDVLEVSDNPDEFYRAKAVHTLALLARELPLGAEVDRVYKTLPVMRWMSGTKVPRVQTTRYLGWVEAVRGNELAAFRAFRDASALAPSEHWRVLCLTDRAYLARNTGEKTFALDVLHEAHEIAERLSWHDAMREERSALFVLAELFAPVDPALSQKYLAQFRTLNTSVLLGISYDDDPRIGAYAGYSSGKAMLELGEREEAIALLSEAHDTFDAFHYGWRAALCALALHQATGESSWLTEARRKVAPWPNSWIARDIATAAEKSEHAGLLTKAQRRVLDLLLEGKSNADIGKALGRSPFTVRNHIAQLFRTYNVSNRTQLAGLFRTHKRS